MEMEILWMRCLRCIMDMPEMAAEIDDIIDDSIDR